MFVLERNFLSVFLKNFLETGIKMGKEIKKCINTVLKGKIFGYAHMIYGKD